MEQIPNQIQQSINYQCSYYTIYDAIYDPSYGVGFVFYDENELEEEFESEFWQTLETSNQSVLPNRLALSIKNTNFCTH